MKIKQITENTTSGSIATVDTALGGTQSRGNPSIYGGKKVGSLFKGKKTKAPYANSINESAELSEAHLEEDDIIVVPGQGRSRKNGFVPHGKSRVDHEVEMARSDLFSAAKNAKQVYEMIQDVSEEEGLDGWVQEKIIKANDYLNTIREYLEGKQVQGVNEGLHPVIIDDIKKLATLNPVDRHSAYRNIHGNFGLGTELNKLASDLMGGYYNADMLRGKYKTAEAKAKYAELEPMHQSFIKQALGQEQGLAEQTIYEGMPADNDMGATPSGAKMTLGQWKQMWMKKMPNADFAAMFRSPPSMPGSAIAYFDGWMNNPDARWDPQRGVSEGSQRGDTLVTDALKIMRGPEVNDAVKALKTVLGDREYNSRRGFYNFYVKQILDTYGQQGMAEAIRPIPVDDQGNRIPDRMSNNKPKRPFGQPGDAKSSSKGVVNYTPTGLIHSSNHGDVTPRPRAVSEGAKVDRMVKHVAQSEKKLGHSKKEAENIAWATANKRGMLNNKNKKA